jgi:hypothetical protein
MDCAAAIEYDRRSEHCTVIEILTQSRTPSLSGETLRAAATISPLDPAFSASFSQARNPGHPRISVAALRLPQASRH